MKSAVLKLLNYNNCDSPYYSDTFVDYIITKKISQGKYSFNDIYDYLCSIYKDEAVVDNDLLNYYLITNYDLDDNEKLTISSYQEKALQSTSDNTLELDCNDDVFEDILKENLLLFEKKDTVDLCELFNSMQTFQEGLRNSIIIYRKLISNYLDYYYESVFYDITYRRDIYESMIYEKLEKSKGFGIELDLYMMYKDNNVRKLFNIYKIKKLDELLELDYNNFLKLFPFDFKYIIQKFDLLNAQSYDYFMEKNYEFVDKLKPNYMIIIRDRIAGQATLQDMGDKLGITRERVRQIEEKLTKKICGLYQGDAQKFIYNIYSLVKEKSKYVFANELFDLFHDGIIRNILMCYLKNNEDFALKYDSYYGIIYDKSITSIDEIVDSEVANLPDIININTFNIYDAIQQMYISENYNFKKNAVYMKKGLNETELYLNIIEEFFPNGFKVNDEDSYNKLMSKCKDIYGIEEGTSMRYISSLLDRNENYSQIERGKFINRKKLPTLPKNLFKKIKSDIIDSKYALPYGEIFSKYKNEFNDIGISNQYMLKGILDNMLTNDFKTSRDYVTFGDKPSIWDAVLSIIRNYKGIFNYDDIIMEFPYVTYTILQGILAYEMNNNGLINLYNKKYVYAQNTNIDFFKEKIKEKVRCLLDNSDLDFITASKVYAKIALSSDNFLIDFSFKVDSMNIYSIIKYLLPDDYIYRRPLIIKLNSDLKNTISAVSQYLSELDEFDDEMLDKFLTKNSFGRAWYYNYNLICEYMADKFVRIDKHKMIKKEFLNIDEYIIKKVDEGLNNLIDRYDELILSGFEAFFVFPVIDNYKWNEYLLIGIINSYLSDKYTVIREENKNVVRRVSDEL